MSTVSAGQSVLPFSQDGIDGKSYALNQNGARLTLAVVFKATCPTCQMTWPYLEKLYQTYRGAGLAVWGISQDGHSVSTQFASDYHSTFPILIDADLRVSRAFNPQFVPTLFLIDPEGKIVDRIIAFDKARLNQLAETVAARLGMPAATIAPADDGNPPFKPG